MPPKASLSDRYPLSFCLTIAASVFFFASFQWTFATVPGCVQQLGGHPTRIALVFGLFTLVPTPTNKGLPSESGNPWHSEKSETT